MIHVELVEDYPLVRRGTRALLQDAPDIVIVAETGQGDEAVALARRLRPDVVLLDLHLLPGLSGIDVARILRQDLPEIKVLILSAYGLETYVRRLFAIGVHGYVLKNVSEEGLIVAVRAVQGGEQWLSPEIAAHFAARRRGIVVPATDILTERERDVLGQIGQGKSNKEIALTLGVETSTVESHVHNALAKLGVHSRTQALARAMEQGIIGADHPPRDP